MSQPTYEIQVIGGRAHVVFPTFVIPAADRSDAERRGNLAVAQGRRHHNAADSGVKGLLVDYGKAALAAEKQRVDGERAAALARGRG